jgi:hypothetical protein
MGRFRVFGSGTNFGVFRRREPTQSREPNPHRLHSVCDSNSLPGAIVHGVLVGGAGHRHVPSDGPLVDVVEPLAGVGLRRGVKQPPGLEFVGLEEAAGLRNDERRASGPSR